MDKRGTWTMVDLVESRRLPPGDKPPEITRLAKTFFGEYILLTFLYFLIIAIRLDF